MWDRVIRKSLRNNLHHQINVSIFILKNVNDTLKAVMTTEQNIQKLLVCICIFPQCCTKWLCYEKHCRSHTETINFSQLKQTVWGTA